MVVLLPESIIEENDLKEGDKLDIQLQNGNIILKPCKNKIREGWAKGAKQANIDGDDRILMNFENKFDDEEWDW
ncbi:hypothetical protein DFO77_11621 [Marinilabilia salmonicolor]|uniref:SpoVT-AbrB domain-containing protein n=2 Tax=Marinilabilia salmonicolor TaxID=989 RepID=A0A368UX29_9BACT|nr:hypothetical protein DFO77_11621 [Marinilabilia salmonicolor]